MKTKMKLFTMMVALGFVLLGCASSSSDKAHRTTTKSETRQSADAARQRAERQSEQQRRESDVLERIIVTGAIDREVESASPTITLHASRIFTGPHDYPPEEFAAYGIVAFKSAANGGSQARHEMICRGYAGSLAPSDSLSVPAQRQMVTVWPVNDPALADALNQQSPPGCEAAVAHYDLPTGLTAIAQAMGIGSELDCRG
ncbi:MAG: hypothetical protein HUJ31_03530, partial [Pseudomonadales bacterium]|nr:hypothetical protein [Pseudomonadales bacterium]